MVARRLVLLAWGLAFGASQACSSLIGLDDLEAREKDVSSIVTDAAVDGAVAAPPDAGAPIADAAPEAGSAAADSGTPSAQPDAAVPRQPECELGSSWSEDAGKCVTPCDLAMCAAEHARCTVVEGRAECECIAPYLGDGMRCEFDASCALLACDVHAACVVAGAAERACECLQGYAGNGESCTNVDECGLVNPACDPHATCEDNDGSFSCRCNDGYVPDGQSCVDPDDCATAPCGAGGTCSDRTGGYKCACFDGYSGDRCETDACQPNPCPGGIPCTRIASGAGCIPACADTPGERCAIGEACASGEQCATGDCDVERHVCFNAGCIDPAGSEVVVIGDSFVTWNSNAMITRLQQLAQTAGSLPSEQSFRDYALAGAGLAAGFSRISSQYDSAKGSPIRVLIMTGGGDDVVLGEPSCTSQAPPANVACAGAVQRAVEAADALIDQALADGVDHVIYFFYPHVSGAPLNATLDYAYTMMSPVCSGPRCHFIDLRPAFEGRGWIAADGIHPTAEGSAAIADAIWAVMQAQCILTD